MQRSFPVVALTALVALVTLSACLDEDYELAVSVGPTGTGLRPLGYQLGDTVQFVAAEIVSAKSRYGPTGPTSADDPARFSWASSNSSVADMIGPGRFVMRGTGEDSIAVETATVRHVFRIVVVPRVTSLRLAPHDATIDIGETVTMDVDPLDAGGNVISSIKSIPRMIIARPSPSASGVYAVLMDGSDLPPFVLHGVQSGTGRVPVVLNIYRPNMLGDTAIVVVR
jgi:hypothetical protein